MKLSQTAEKSGEGLGRPSIVVVVGVHESAEWEVWKSQFGLTKASAMLLAPSLV